MPVSLFSCPCCGLLAEDVRRFVVDSTDGPIEYFHACCIQLHRFTLPAEAVAERVARDVAAEPTIVPVVDIEFVETGPEAEETPLDVPVAETPQPFPVARPDGPPSADILPFPSRVPFAGLRTPRTWLAGGAFVSGGITSGFLLNMPVALAFAVVLGLLAVIVVSSLIPMALASHKSAKVALLGAENRAGPAWDTKRKAA
jgi:hypothetical protein